MAVGIKRVDLSLSAHISFDTIDIHNNWTVVTCGLVMFILSNATLFKRGVVRNVCDVDDIGDGWYDWFEFLLVFWPGPLHFRCSASLLLLRHDGRVPPLIKHKDLRCHITVYSLSPTARLAPESIDELGLARVIRGALHELLVPAENLTRAHQVLRWLFRITQERVLLDWCRQLGCIRLTICALGSSISWFGLTCAANFWIFSRSSCWCHGWLHAFQDGVRRAAPLRVTKVHLIPRRLITIFGQCGAGHALLTLIWPIRRLLRVWASCPALFAFLYLYLWAE